ncbi:MAG TPA: aldehyde dehydrogenase family protein, partial [Ignavibacteriaceae bacterium]|nr:aldehyde dehydrogenase family protein [Ignavibacteriaceae bacterium]
MQVLEKFGIKEELFNKLSLNEKNYGACSGLNWIKNASESVLQISSPATGEFIASVYQASNEDYEKVISSALEAFKYWRKAPAPKRGEVVRQIGLKLREYKKELGTLVSFEMGKSLQEGLGEVQEMIDICDFALGQSRQLYGFTMQSERAKHRMFDQYHPLGIVGIITAFNFPVAVWAWNAMISAVCGNVNLWKPSSKVPLSAIAVQNVIAEVLRNNSLPEGIFSLIICKGSTIGDKLLRDKRVPLISITGSTKVGKHAAEIIAGRFGKSILELGGNNAVIITPDADLKIAIPSVVFGAVGTAGQRCTTTRRLIVHDSIYDKIKESLLKAYGSLRIGNPLDEKNHVGPLIDKDAVKTFCTALERIKQEGGKIIFGGEVLSGSEYGSGCYVKPAIAEVENHFKIVQEETFAPILYLIKYKGDVQNAVSVHNDVAQGLSSGIFTNN